MHPRLVFCDMDGTFLRSDKTISDLSLQVAGEWLPRQGAQFVPCTGRMLSGIPAELAGRHGVRYAVCSMGATIVEFGPDGAHDVFEGGVDKRDVIALYDALRGMDLLFDVFANGRGYTERRQLAHLGEYPIEPGMMGFVRQSRVPVDQDMPSFVAGLDRVERLNIYVRTPEDMRRVRAVLEGMPAFSCTEHDGCGLEVVSAQLSKGTALRWLAASLGVDVAQTVAFGDGENDVPMLDAAGLGVAMANANEVCKAHAQRVTSHDNDHDGVARFLHDEMGDAWQS